MIEVYVNIPIQVSGLHLLFFGICLVGTSSPFAYPSF